MEGNNLNISQILEDVFAKQNEIEEQLVINKQILEKHLNMYNTEKQEYENVKQKFKSMSRKIISLDESIKHSRLHFEELKEKLQKVSSSIGTKQYLQKKANVVLQSESIRHLKYYQLMSSLNKKVESTTDSSSPTEDIKKNISILKNTLVQKRQEQNHNLKEIKKLENEIMILKKRNNALIIRLKRQVSEAEASGTLKTMDIKSCEYGK